MRLSVQIICTYLKKNGRKFPLINVESEILVMLKSINHQDFVNAMKRDQRAWILSKLNGIEKDMRLAELETDFAESVSDRVDYFIENIDPQLEQCVQAWIKGETVFDFAYGEYTIESIMTRQRAKSYPNVFYLMSRYIADPESGKVDIENNIIF